MSGSSKLGAMSPIFSDMIALRRSPIKYFTKKYS
jgi:hypothetical protein